MGNLGRAGYGASLDGMVGFITSITTKQTLNRVSVAVYLRHL